MSITTIKINDACFIGVDINKDSFNENIGSIISEGLHLAEGDEEHNEEYEAAIDGIESLILGLACAGVEVSTEQFKKGVVSALDAIGNQY